jgi:hypothetical protein
MTTAARLGAWIQSTGGGHPWWLPPGSLKPRLENRP